MPTLPTQIRGPFADEQIVFDWKVAFLFMLYLSKYTLLTSELQCILIDWHMTFKITEFNLQIYDEIQF